MRLLASLAGALLLVACSDDPAGTGAGSGGDGGSAGGGATGGGGGSGAQGGGGADAGMGGIPVLPGCDALPAPEGTIVEIGPRDDLPGAVSAAAPGTTILLEDGSYDLTGSTVWVATDGIAIRGKSGDASAVVLEGGYDTAAGGLISIADASNVTVADLTIRQPRYHAIHVTGTAAPADNALVYNVRIFDPGEQAIKINTGGNGFFADDGTVACSYLELTPAGRAQVEQYEAAGSHCYTGGVDGHQAEGWVIRDNTITGFWCGNADISEHAVHFWTGSRGTRVERNRLVDNARAVGFGLDSSGRSYDDDPCLGVPTAGHFLGVIANNFIAATDPDLFASPNGADSGIALWYACGVTVAHNTIAMSDAPYSAIEWRFDTTSALVVNNLTTHSLVPREEATATTVGNLENVAAVEFVDLAAHDLHLSEGATAIGAGDAQGTTLAPDDIDGDVRPATPDVGADQR
jgi:hypothetical protein